MSNAPILPAARFTHAARRFAGRLVPHLLLISLLVLTGCASSYTIILNRGSVLTAKGKPRLDKATGCYVYTDAYGRQCAVPASSVREIGPSSMTSESTPNLPIKSAPAR